MYLSFFKLREMPFAISSDPRFFFESGIHAEGMANMLYTIQQRKGMVLVTGEVGAGKTYLGSMLAERLGNGATVGMVRHPPDSSKQLLRAVGEAFDVKVGREDDKLDLAGKVEKFLMRQNRRRRTLALILDETQDLPDDAMEEIRLMWNWEHGGQRLLQIVLIGQPELRERLRQPKWESLQQRIVLSYHLGRLSQADTVNYILHRRRVAAAPESELRFSMRALECIYEVTKGIPRMINLVCDNALLVAYANNTQKISSSIIEKVVQTMTTWSVNPDAAAVPDRPIVDDEGPMA